MIHVSADLQDVRVHVAACRSESVLKGVCPVVDIHAVAAVRVHGSLHPVRYHVLVCSP